MQNNNNNPVCSNLAVRVHTGCSVFPIDTPMGPTKQLICLHIKYKTVLFPKLLIISIF